MSSGSGASGAFTRTSYVSSWSVSTLKHADIDRGVGALSSTLVSTVVSEIERYLH